MTLDGSRGSAVTPQKGQIGARSISASADALMTGTVLAVRVIKQTGHPE
jgi:hypothetical protein